jgi:uncharacterized coiled-coil DUF342 family protein
MPQSYDKRFDRLEALIERGFAAVAQDVAAIKVQIGALQTETRESRSNIKDIRASLEALDTKIRNTAGFAKEIEYLFSNYVSKRDNVRARSRKTPESGRR